MFKINKEKVVKNYMEAGVLPTFIKESPEEIEENKEDIMLYIAYMNILKEAVESELKNLKTYAEKELPQDKTTNKYFNISFVKPSKSWSITKKGKEYFMANFKDQEEYEDFFEEKFKTGYFTWNKR